MNHVKKLFWISVPVGLVVLLGILGWSVLPAFAQGGTISGTVTSPEGYPLPAGTVVKLFEPDGETVYGQANPDLDDGTYSLGPVPNGLYVLKAVPPAGSGLAQSLPRPVSVVNNPVTGVDLHLSTPQILATVVAPDGVTPTDAVVTVFAGDWQIVQHVPAPGGQALIGGLPPGGYWLQAAPDSDQPFWKSEPVAVSVPDLVTTQSVTLTLTPADIWGAVQDEYGVPIANSKVVAAGGGGVFETDRTSGSGFWAIGGLSPGTYALTAFPPLHNAGLIHSDPLSFTLPGASNPYILTLNSPPKLVQGEVRTNTGTAVVAAQVVARRVNQQGQAEALTGADGTYELDLSPGLWALTVRAITDTTPADWVYPLPPQLVHFQHNNDPETRQQDFTVLTADATVNGSVAMPDGSPPPFTVTVGLHNDEGIGRATQIDPGDGSFEISLPNGGYKVAVHPDDPEHLGPVVAPIQVPPNGTYDLGILTLVSRDALITGTLSTDSGDGVEGVPVVAWREGAPGSLGTISGPEGMYALAVSGEDWQIQPAPGPEHPYIYTGTAELVSVPPGGVVSDVDFTLLAADAVIEGVLVDEGGEPVSDADGWALADHVGDLHLQNGAPILQGHFTIYVPGGTYNVLAHLPAGSPYLSTGEQQVSVAGGDTVSVTLTVREKDARIVGALWDPRNQDVVSGVSGGVAAWEEYSWAATHIDAGNGTYQLGVAAGLWHLNYRIDPTSGYVKIVGPRNIPVQSGQTVGVPLPIIPRDAVITGTVSAPDGSPLPGAVVLAKGISSEVNGLWLHTRSGEDGEFRLPVPYGRYRLGATAGVSEWIKPVEKLVTVFPGSASGGHELQFQIPDAAISGTLTVTNTTTGGAVFVWAWSDDGGFTAGRFPVSYDPGLGQASGPYQLGVISGTVWHLGAVFETPSQYWRGRAIVPVDETSETQDLELGGPHPKPAPVVVTFDADDPQRISLADGTHIYIPPGAMPVSGMVTLRIVPIATLPHQQHARVLKYGYAFLATDEAGAPIESHFNQDVVISFHYDEAALVDREILEPWLKPAYFSTTTNLWTFPESYVVDTEENRVIMQIDHFTDFALMGSPAEQVYLPMLHR